MEIICRQVNCKPLKETVKAKKKNMHGKIVASYVLKILVVCVSKLQTDGAVSQNTVRNWEMKNWQE